MSNFQVSVIIPVYNAENYLLNAVKSVMQFSCVQEILLVEDASPDNALSLCKQLEKEYPIVKLFTHPNNENRGAGASRNLGIEKAKARYFAFLDADDWYLPNRFDAELELFENPQIDGVYGATGFYYENEKQLDPDRLTSFEKEVSPKELLHEILRPNGGRLHTNAITIKKSALDTVGYMNTSLRLHQDSEFWNRMAFHARLKTGIIKEAVAIRRVHDNNRIANANTASSKQYNAIVFNYFKIQSISKQTFRIILKNYIITEASNSSSTSRAFAAIVICIKNPFLLLKII